METIVHNIRDLCGEKRTAAEQLVGHELREEQRLMIQVTDAAADATSSKDADGNQAPWSHIYEGLSDDRIEELDQAIRQRANLTRTFE